MGGIVIAFQKFIPAVGLFGKQEWIGLGNYRYVLALPGTMQVLFNTVYIAVLKIFFGMAVPIAFALLINEVINLRYKRVLQTVFYFPYFISWIIFGGILLDILSPTDGIVNRVLNMFGINSIFFLGSNKWFRGTLVFTDIWKNFGFGTVIYLATLTTIDPTQYEVAAIDGASRWKQMIHITLPGLRMIILLMFVLNLGNILNAGFDQIFNVYSPQVYETGDIIDTLVYRMGITDARYGPATAVGLFKSVVSTLLISTSYYIAWKRFDYTLF